MIKVALFGRGRSQEPEWVVLLTVAVALLIGWLIQMSVVTRMDVATVGSAGVSYPHGWSKVSEEGSAFSAADLLGGGVFGPRISLWQLSGKELTPVAGTGNPPSLTTTASAWSIKRSAKLAAYRVLAIEPSKVQGREAVDITYAYLAEGSQGAVGQVVPRVMQAIDTVVASGDQFYILSFAASSDEFAGLGDLHQRVLSTWRLP